MVELETKLIPTLGNKIALWQRYVDDTFTFIKSNEIENVKGVLDKFHQDIKFTHEVEKQNSISFLDVKITKKPNGRFITEVHRKKTDTNIYVNWKSFSPRSWKIGTLKGLFRRAYVVCSEKSGLDKEISFLKYVFTKINGYPSRVVNDTLWEVIKATEKEKSSANVVTNKVSNTIPKENPGKEEVFPHVCLPYKGPEGEKVMKGLKTYLTKILPKEVKPRFVYKGKKVGSFFTLKDPIKTEHLSNLVYGHHRSNNSKRTCYVGETNVRYESRTYEHSFTDKQSSIYKHAQANNYTVSPNDFRIIERGFNKRVDRKIAEALYIKELKPELNEQVKSFKLHLFS